MPSFSVFCALILTIKSKGRAWQRQCGEYVVPKWILRDLEARSRTIPSMLPNSSYGP